MLFLFLSILMIPSSVAQPPESEIVFLRLDHNGHKRFLPQNCCQFCGKQDEYKNYSYVDGRCMWFQNGSSPSSTDVSSAHDPHKVHVHRHSCCYFCGFAPNEFTYKNSSNGYCEQVVSGLNDFPSTQCIVCESVLAVVKEMIDSQKESIRDQLFSYCGQTVLLRNWCRKLVQDNIEEFIFFVQSSLHISEICFRFVKVCPEPKNFELTAPTRSSILDPRVDGLPLSSDVLLSLGEITINNLNNFIVIDCQSPEQYLDNLKFLARYELIYNKHDCKECGGSASLIRQKDLIDQYVWRCADCKKQRIVKTSVRYGSFFFGLKKKTSLIIAIAATFVGKPTISLEDIISEYVIERPTLITYQNYFLDVIQLVITRRASNLIGGQSKIVDIEHSVLYTQKHKTTLENRPFTQCIVFIERGTQEYAIVEVSSLDASTLTDAVSRSIRDGTKLASSDFQKIGGAAHVQTTFDNAIPNKGIKFYDFDAVAVRSSEATKNNELKLAYLESSKKNSHRAGLVFMYILHRSYPKPFNAFLYGLSLYDPSDSSL